MSQSNEKEQIDLIAAELHGNRICDAMFSHYGPYKRCEDVARSLYESGIRHVIPPGKDSA